MLALLWPADPYKNDPEGDVELHKEILKYQKNVYWDISKKISQKRIKEIEKAEKPINGYIYVAGEGKVKYRCNVEEVVSRGELLSRKSEQRFVPYFRMQCLEGSYGDGSLHKQSETWIKISKISCLSQSREKSDFLKLNGELIQGDIRSIIYIQDPIYK